MRFATIFFAFFFSLSQLAAFETFTGKVTGNNVRMRLAPNLEAQVFKELDRDDMLLVTGESEDFYACMPPQNLKAYTFRTYVLDGAVEGSNVFVRLGPDRASPAITQLNSGDKVKGKIAPENSKWMEIELPEDVRFYVSKDYVQKVGDANCFARQESKKQEAAKTLADLKTQLHEELEKPFQQIQLASLSQRLNQFIIDHKDMPKLQAQAESLIAEMQQSYLTKSVAVADTEALPEDLPQPSTPPTPATPPTAPEPMKPLTTLSWQEQENAFVEPLIANGEAESCDDFYGQELKMGNTLHGVIKPYSSLLSTRPGDFVLLNLKTNLPIAYLYSTKVDLSSCVNKPVTLWVSERPNNNYAFPAYFVLQVEE